ncbi:MAG TPA: hypothetical protein VIG08_16835 [Gemmatimonadales bacterium]|jgi:hypothetical protein
MMTFPTIRPPVEPDISAPPATSCCPLPAVFEWPRHPSGLVLVLYTTRPDGSAPAIEALVAELREAGLGTMLVDLAAGPAGKTLQRAPALLLEVHATRVMDWVAREASLASLAVGVVGVNGVTAATLSAARASSRAEAVVIWGGQPGEAADALAGLKAPALVADPGSKSAAHWVAVWLVHHLALEPAWRRAREARR